MKTQFQIQSKRINIHLTGAENRATSVSLSSNLVEKVMRPFEQITGHGKTKPKQTRINENYYWHPIENHANAGNRMRETTGSNMFNCSFGVILSITACYFQKPIRQFPKPNPHIQLLHLKPITSVRVNALRFCYFNPQLFHYSLSIISFAPLVHLSFLTTDHDMQLQV